MTYTGQNMRITGLHVKGEPEITFLVRQVVFKNIVTPTWNSEAAYGKMDNIPYYSNTTRQVQISFQSVVTADVNYTELELLDNIATLQKFQYPRYSFAKQTSARVLSSPPFLKIEHFLKDAKNTYYEYEPVTGYLVGGLVIQAGSEEGVGGQKLNLQYGPNISGAKINSAYEIGYQVNMNLTVLHERPPGWVGSEWVADTIYFGDNATRTDDPSDTITPDADVKEP